MGGLNKPMRMALAHADGACWGWAAESTWAASTVRLERLHALWQSMQLLQCVPSGALSWQCAAGAGLAQSRLSVWPCAVPWLVGVSSVSALWCTAACVDVAGTGCGMASIAMASPSRPRRASRQIMNTDNRRRITDGDRARSRVPCCGAWAGLFSRHSGRGGGSWTALG